MKKVFFALATIVAVSIALVACKDDESTPEVKLSKPELTLLEGQTAELTLEQAVANVKWASSNVAVATVDENGKVTALSLGKATINAYAGGSSSYCEVYVVAPVESLSMKETDSMFINTKVSLLAIVKPASATNTNLAWTSSDSTIAKVNNKGEVSALAYGTAVITATTLDGSNKSASCTMKVKQQLVTGVALSRGNMRSLFVGRNFPLTVTVSPADATVKGFTYKSSDDAIASITDTLINVNNVPTPHVVVTAISAGDVIITVTSDDGGKTASCEVRVLADYPTPTIGGVKWAATNLDGYKSFAATPDMYTAFFQWGDTIAHSATAPGAVPGWKKIADLQKIDTWAKDPCPDGWRLPKQAELLALKNAQTPRQAAAGADGVTVAGTFYAAQQIGQCRMFQMYGDKLDAPQVPEGCVFFPASGWRSDADGTISNQGVDKLYWSSEQWADNNTYASVLLGGNTIDMKAKSWGLNVRCVQEP